MTGVGDIPARRLPSAPEGRSLELLKGVRVLDLTGSIAAPYATMLLGDFGADVLKIERPGRGDDARAWGPPFLDGESLWFLSVNRSKRSVSLDIASDEGRLILQELVRHCDVVVVNVTERVQKKLRIDYETLRSLREDIVHVSVTGWGMTGPRAAESGYDLIAEAFSGVMDITGEPDSPPQKIGAPAADILAGMDAALSTVAALYDRLATGQGHRIDVSLVESMTRMLSPRIVTYLGTGEIPRRTGARDSVIAVYQTFDTSDDPIAIGLGNDQIWRRFWEAVGEPEYADQEVYASNASRREHREQIVKDIAVVLARRPRAYWLELLAEHRVPAGPINSIDEVVADHHLLDRGLFYRLDRNGTLIPQVGLGITVDGEPAFPREGPPVLGADTEAVLTQLASVTPERIEELRGRNVI